VLGTRDYIRKCGFSRVLIGLSGGIDSSLTAAIAVEAVGRENVTGVGMPGPFSSDHSVRDARDMAERLGIRFEMVGISAICERFEQELAPLFVGRPRDVTEENLQSRARGVVLMALSNKTGALVLTTGNKSELAVGYCTLYGDMCGGLAVISDVPKTMVYMLTRIANVRHKNAIPETCSPSRLRPSCARIKRIPIRCRITRCSIASSKPMSSSTARPAEIARELELPIELVQDIVNKVDRNEYKRQQAAPGLKVTTKAFGIGRRFPIAQRFLRMKIAASLRVAFVVVCAGVLCSQPSWKEQVGKMPDGSFMLPTGWRIQPVGQQVPLDTLPMSSILSQDGNSCWC
jgi:NAD+ synthetase